MTDFELEIQKARLEYDIMAYKAQLLQEQVKLLEIKKNQAVIEAKVADVKAKITEKEAMLASM